jgi:diaminohydroxyphosphoribosylaminopyrimidine deaminase / 5-amino-6-(5-phosphoribosylamino)uracil reductase
MSHHFMSRALELAAQKVGRTSPNPSVGAVVVRDGEIVGEGNHDGPGTAHAEVVALAAAGGLARDADVYVTLEPCSFIGRTGACTSALIDAGIRRVVYAMDDPDPRTHGQARETLAEAGIQVDSGLLESEAQRLLEPYSHQRRTGRPFVTAKFAMSLDGKIAAAGGDSRWISSPESRELAHELRTRVDAILVGSETVVVDNPQLTARPLGKPADHQPLPVVLDGRGRVSPEADVFGGPGRTLVITTSDSTIKWRKSLEAVADVEAVGGGPSGEGVNPTEVLRVLNDRGVLHALIEGGGRINGSFFDSGLVDKVYAVIAPMILGGSGRSPVAGSGAQRMADAWRLERVTVTPVGPDLLVEGYPQRRD